MARSIKKTRADRQLSALAGELFVAAELLKRGHQTSVTFGNAKSIDLLAHNPRIDQTFPIQVKALRKVNYFLLGHNQVKSGHIYVFVLLNDPGEAVQYFIVPGDLLINRPECFGKYFQITKMPGIHPKDLKEFAGAWHYFEEVPKEEAVEL